jgi:hypothetical protein
LRLQAEVFERLNSAARGLSVFQALPNEDYRHYSPDDREDDIVCGPYSNFARVGYFNSKQYHPKRGGDFNSRFLPRAQEHFMKCADLYVNGGFTETDDDEPGAILPVNPGDGGLFFRRLGLVMDPVGMMATSWATPLALAHAVHLKQMGQAESVGKFRALYKTRDGHPMMIDPVKHKQFELYV